MNRVLLLLAGILLASAGFAQTDTTKQNDVDTVKVGNFIIIRKNKDKDKSFFVFCNFNEEKIFN